MAERNQPKDDADKMYAEYVTGTPIDEIATKYNHTSREVEDVVTNVQPKVESKKGK